MAIRITNTLTGEKQEFKPQDPKRVTMYVCGPTVYGLTHIGNARPVVFFGVVRQYLESCGYEVKYVSNFTDVDDKIINRAREDGSSWKEVASKYEKEFLVDMDALHIKRPDVAPRVTDHIAQIISLIEQLVAKQAAYVTDEGEVFFSVRNFSDYGKLSGKKVDDLLVGARVDRNDKKKDPLDFSLWKPQKAHDEPAWESPWGKGRPGWHIECSVMAIQYLGETFDIHGGGMDLIHPHHENEIAQSEAATDKPFVCYWMHCNMLTKAAEKMSKSLGNIFTNRDFIEKYSGEVLKMMLLSAHYRSTIDYSDPQINSTRAALHRIYVTLDKCRELSSESFDVQGPVVSEEKQALEFHEQFEKKWRQAMDDDFNTARAIARVFDYVRIVNTCLWRKKFKRTEATGKVVSNFLNDLSQFSKVFNILGEDSREFLEKLRNSVIVEKGLSAQAVESKVLERVQARQDRDYEKADAIRDELLQMGVEVQDGQSGSSWDVIFTESQP